MDEALLAYRRAIAADPLERDAQPLYHAGQILMYQGQYEEAQAQRQRGNWIRDGKSVWCEIAGDGLVLAGSFFFRNKMVKHGYVMIYMHDDDDLPCFIGMFIVLHCM